MALRPLKDGELVYVPSHGKLQEGKVVRPEMQEEIHGYMVRLVAGRAGRESRAEEWYPAAAVQAQTATEERLAKGARGSRRQHRVPELKIGLPDSLRWQLVNDWEQVCRKHVVVSLPRHPSVIDILYSFREASRDAEGYTHNELVNSLQEYFDDALYNMLLYDGEAEMHSTVNQTLNTDKAPSTIFGAEHLLRLVVKLPELLAATDVADHRVNIIQSQLYDFVTFLAQNQAAFFQLQYALGE